MERIPPKANSVRLAPESSMDATVLFINQLGLLVLRSPPYLRYTPPAHVVSAGRR